MSMTSCASARRYRSPLVALLVAGVALLCPSFVNPATVAAQPVQRDIMETLRADPRFSTLVRAVEAAGLADTLKAPGPYTLYAPTDEAFRKLGTGTVDSLLQDQEALRRLLRTHIAPGYVTAAQAVQVPSVPNVLGEPIIVSTADSSVYMNDGRVIEPDLRASNGVIQVVDMVWTKEALNPRALPTAGEAETGGPFVALIGAVLIAAGLAVSHFRARATQ